MKKPQSLAITLGVLHDVATKKNWGHVIKSILKSNVSCIHDFIDLTLTVSFGFELLIQHTVNMSQLHYLQHKVDISHEWYKIFCLIFTFSKVMLKTPNHITSVNQTLV